jgi:hypothetical protein
MVYYIFLKSIRSLKEFRKNPHIKIPPKSPPTNIQSLGTFKNQFFIQKIIFPSLSAQLARRPVGPSSLSAQPRPLFFPTGRSPSPHWASASRQPSPPSRPSRLRVSGALPDCRLPHGEMPHLMPPSPLSVPG